MGYSYGRTNDFTNLLGRHDNIRHCRPLQFLFILLSPVTSHFGHSFIDVLQITIGKISVAFPCHR